MATAQTATSASQMPASARQIRPCFVNRTEHAIESTGVDRLIAAFLRIRGLDRLDDAFMTRAWLAADMGISGADLDRLLKLLRWQGLITLPNEHLVAIADPDAIREIAMTFLPEGVSVKPIAEQPTAGASQQLRV